MSEEKQTGAEKAEQEKATKRAANIAARRERLAGIKDRIAKRKAARADKAKDAAKDAKKARSGKAVKK